MKRNVFVRIGQQDFRDLQRILFRRYPDSEWATFARFGWRESLHGLVLTLAAVDPPKPKELDDTVEHVAIQEPYTLRVALAAEMHSLAVGVLHSHPDNCAPLASSIDDDMDGYYSEYFSAFAPGRPYASLILARMHDGEIAISGRVFLRGEWLQVSRFVVECEPVRTWTQQNSVVAGVRERTARLASAFGARAASRLRTSSAAVIGAGGTGSAAIEVLVRAGVGRIVIVDPDHITESNLERVHGSHPPHVEKGLSKALLAREHALSIDPSCSVCAYKGALPQPEIVDVITTCDVALGCTDQQHSRLALSDISNRYILPSIDCGVALEGNNGKVTGQIVQLVRFLSTDPCALCREMINPIRVAEELMSVEDRVARQAEAEAAAKRGEDPNPYWRGLPQLNTVGYLTTMAGAMAAGYAIGWLTGSFDPPFLRIQMNIGAPLLDVQEVTQEPRDYCSCGRMRGWADQGCADALITAPVHWPEPRLVP